MEQKRRRSASLETHCSHVAKKKGTADINQNQKVYRPHIAVLPKDTASS